MINFGFRCTRIRNDSKTHQKKPAQEEDVGNESHGIGANTGIYALRVCAWLVRWLDLLANDIWGTPLACAVFKSETWMFLFKCTTCWFVFSKFSSIVPTELFKKMKMNNLFLDKFYFIFLKQKPEFIIADQTVLQLKT